MLLTSLGAALLVQSCASYDRLPQSKNELSVHLGSTFSQVMTALNMDSARVYTIHEPAGIHRGVASIKPKVILYVTRMNAIRDFSASTQPTDFSTKKVEGIALYNGKEWLIVGEGVILRSHIN